MHGITETILDVQVPRPLLASLTNWWRFFDVRGRRPEITHIDLHRKYGDVVRLGPNTLSFSNPKALKAIYGLNKGFIKSDFYIVQQSVVKGHRLASLFSTTDNTFHAQFRRCVNSAFAMSALVQYEPFVDNTTKLFLDRTEELFANNPEGCDFTRWLQFYAFDVIGEITYSKRHGFIEKNEDIDGIVDYLGKLFLYVAPIGQIPFLDLLFLKNPIYLKLSQWGLLDSTFPVARFARDRMAERLPELGTGGKPAESTAILPVSDAKTLPLRSPSSPTCSHQAAKEIDDAAKDGVFSDTTSGLVTFHEAQKLQYLDACPAGGVDIGGHFVKGGTIVGCSAWVIHRRPEIFGDDVDEYRPERWLPRDGFDRAEEEKRIKTMDGTMVQFGMGSRTCIGKNISLLEIYKLVPSFLRRFEVELQEPDKEWEIINAWFVKQVYRAKFKNRAIVQPLSEKAAA
ncbi:unnamed protein product [Parascedosporium putredinis]|uniref:Cytochrome P450 n=1 Tax=Parascedosporium putredinis TaxID=1442378 RepID=A0A9P1MBM2_9PEZI|nr:unnamed protein product [Parascedosporium putredinis]CAI7999837.1 unnamed protein product [Parascedosporium putredinis]